MFDQIFERSDALRRNSRARSGKNVWLISTTGANRERLEARCGSLLSICWLSLSA